jgi:ribonuclease T2
MKSLSISAGFFLFLLIAGCKADSSHIPASQPNAFQTRAVPAQDFGANPGYGQRRSRRGRADAQAAPGAFDFYLLNLSWSPEFCTTHGDSPECGHGLGFVVHGLWPQYANGDYPEDCSDAPGPANPQAYTDIIPTVSLVAHEWQTHGTCSGLAADAYFTEIRRAFSNVKIPAQIGSSSGPASLPPDQLLASFASANPGYPADSFALSCGNNRLTAIEICLTKDLQPENCSGVRSCRANVVQITPR